MIQDTYRICLSSLQYGHTTLQSSKQLELFILLYVYKHQATKTLDDPCPSGQFHRIPSQGRGRVQGWTSASTIAIAIAIAATTNCIVRSAQ